MKRVHWLLLSIAGALASGCHPAHAPQSSSASATAPPPPTVAAEVAARDANLGPPPSAPAGIAWFDGTVDQAFALAKREGRPVLLFWGAQWCPFCHTLKATVFVRPDFLAKARLFVPVYLDGDNPGAQSWGERFGVLGYPTLLVLDADQHEIIRLGAGRDVAEYAAVLDAALEDLQPIDALLRLAASGHALTTDQCRRLAFNSWDLDTVEASRYGERATALAAASQRCASALERANLTIYAANFESRIGTTEGEGVARPSARRGQLIDQVADILAKPQLAVAVAPALTSLDDGFFKATRAYNPNLATSVRDGYVQTMERAAVDPRYAVADQLGFIDAQIAALKGLSAAPAPLPSSLLSLADQRIDAALAAEQSSYVRPGLVNAALNILEDTDQYAKAYQIAKAEIGRADSPYYFQADLAEIAEKLGHKDEAIQLLDLAYHGARGPATRFQWGMLYVSGLLRMAPNDSGRIEDVTQQVLGELDGPDRIAARARVRLTKLDEELRRWNSAAQGKHAAVLRALHTRLQQICVRIPSQQPERTSCDAFLRRGA